MSCTCSTSQNKNVLNRLYPEYADSTVENRKYLVYIRGNYTNPLGVVSKLVEFGGVPGTTTTSDLMDSTNIFYIDYKNDSKISFVNETTMVAEAILSCWEEIYPSTSVSYTPEDWEFATIDYPTAALFESGEDTTTNEEIHNVGKLKVLRDIYRKGWVPDCTTPFYYIGYRNGELDKGKGTNWTRFLSFQDESTRDLFYDNYKDLINTVQSYI